MRYTNLFRLFGIDVRLHWSFPLLLVWIVVDALLGLSISNLIAGVSFTFGLLFAVLMRGLVRAAALSRMGIRVFKITLSVINALSREYFDEVTLSVRLVACTIGFVTNACLALFGMACAKLIQSPQIWPTLSQVWTPHRIVDPALQFVAVNLFLMIIHAIPVYPMDGGRILRNLLEARTSHERAVATVARLGRYLAGAILILGILRFQLSWILISVFLFVASIRQLLLTRVGTFTTLDQILKRELFGDRNATSPTGWGDSNDPDEIIIESKDVRRLN